jgi:hypothetical protein
MGARGESEKIKSTDMKKGILFLLLSTFLFCDVADARKVSGTVMCGEEKLSDVIVTDGKNFTQTKKGKFKFEIDDNAEFVYIITPSGYVADYNPALAADGVTAGAHLTLTKGDDSVDTIVFKVAEGNESLKVSGDVNTIIFSMEWGSFN